MELSEYQLKVYMERCIELAKNAPQNLEKPHVGAIVLSPNGKVVGEGYKSWLQGTSSIVVHAEMMALDRAGYSAIGGVLIATLEPCYGRGVEQLLGPCVRYILDCRISTVVYGVSDSSRGQRGRGREFLGRGRVNVIQHLGLNERIEAELMAYEDFGRDMEKYAGDLGIDVRERRPEIEKSWETFLGLSQP